MSAAVAPRACPVCGSESSTTCFRQEFKAIDESTPVAGYDVAICQQCGAAYATGIPGQDAFDAYYRRMSKYEYAQRLGAESDYDRRRLAEIADGLAPHLPSRSARILDVGCASGRLLAEIRERGFPNVLGLDLSPGCAAAAKRLYDVEVRTLTLAELARTGERFDVVIMVGVLEHVRDLEAVFADIRSLTSEAALLYVEVPDVAAFADWDNAPYQDFSTEHINFFSATSLVNLMRRQGFRTVFVERNHRVQSYKTVMSNLAAAFERVDRSADVPVEFDHESGAGLERYLRRCAEAENALHRKLDALAASRRPILVWGVGTHTRRLLSTSRLADANIVAFVESSSQYQGKVLHGRPILEPAAVKRYRDPILIGSRVFQNEIAEQIRNELAADNELILLYDV